MYTVRCCAMINTHDVTAKWSNNNTMNGFREVGEVHKNNIDQRVISFEMRIIHMIDDELNIVVGCLSHT
jgi:hypothetical protein